MKHLKIAIAVLAMTFFSTNLLAQDTFVRSAVISLPEIEVGGVGNIISGVDFDGDGKKEIYAVNDNWGDSPEEIIARIYKYENNGGTWDSVWSAVLAAPLVQNTWPALTYDDLDGDNKMEIIWGPVNNLASGNEDPARVVIFEAVGDGSDNLGVSDGSGGWLPNAQWNLDVPTDTEMRPFRWISSDIDNDGTKEIILSDRRTTGAGYHTAVFSVSDVPDNGDGSETWTLEFSGTIATEGIVRQAAIPAVNEPGGFGNVVAGVDFDGDGKKEIYAVNDNWGDTPGELTPRMYKWEWSGSYWEEVWKTELNIEKQNTWPALTYGDWDQDGLMEIIWGPVNNLGSDLNPPRIVVFEQKDDSSDVLGVEAGVGVYEPNASWPIVGVDNANERPFRWELTDIDNDMDLELIFGARAGDLRFGIISVDDIPNNGDGSETWTLEASGQDAGMVVSDGTIYDMAVIDNIAYMIHSNGNVTPIAYEGGAYVSKPIQNGIVPGGSWKSASVVDIDTDGVKEIVVGEWLNNGYNVFLLQQDGDTLKNTIIGDFSSLNCTRLNGGDFGDIDGNGMVDFVFGSRTSLSDPNASIYRLEYLGGDITDPASYTESIIDEKLLETGGQYDIIAFGNLDDDDADELVYSGIPRSSDPVPLGILDYSDGTISGGSKWDIAVIENYIYLFDGSGNVYPVKFENNRWQILPMLSGVVGTFGSFKGSVVADIDNDGKEEIAVGAWSSSGAGKVYLLQPMNGGLKSTEIAELSTVGAARLNGADAGDIDQDGFMDLVFGSRDSEAGIFRVEYRGGDILDPMNYESSKIDSGIDPVGHQTDIITISNVDDDEDLEVVYSGIPRSMTAPATLPIVVLDIVKVQVTDIADLRVDNDGDSVPDLLGQEFTVRAVVTSDNFQANSDDLGIYVQDATAGIFVFANNDDSSSYAAGDLIQITGVVGQFNGQTQLSVSNTGDNIVAQGTGTIPDAAVLTIPEYLENAEMYEGSLVKIEYVELTNGTWPDSAASSTNLTFSDGFNEFPFRVDSDMDLKNNPEPTYPVNIVGIGGQYDNSAPHTDGYQIMATFYADIEQGVQAPPSQFFSLLTPADDTVISITDSSQTWDFTWEASVDLNGEDLIYQWVPMTGSPIFAPNKTSLTFDAETIIGMFGAEDTLVIDWTVQTKEMSGGAGILVASVDTFRVRFVNDIMVGVEEEIPHTFFVDQNYPNPFNPTTTIKFGLPAESSVDLRIYDILGQQVAVIYNNELLRAGTYQHVFDASKLTSGTYIYRLQSKDNVVVKKMMLVK